MPTRFTAEKTAAAIEALSQLRDQQVTLARSWAQELEQVPPHYRPSALNLLHYLALRQHDLWPLQQDLSSLGLSSLGRTEAHASGGRRCRAGRPAQADGSDHGTSRRLRAAGGLLHRATGASGAYGVPPGTGALRPRGSDHGHHAVGGRGFLRLGPRPPAGRHGYHAHQQRPR